MPLRKRPIFLNQIYHLFNRSIAKQPIFFDKRDYLRFCQLIDFYRYSPLGLRFSYFNRLSISEKDLFLENLRKNGEKQVEIYTFCLMPNHFHFQLKELREKGIQKFAANLQNSYAKYINVKKDRTGALFQEQFKAVSIDSDELFVHVARYIHINPHVSFLVKDMEGLKNYTWSSFGSYLGVNNSYGFLETKFLQSFYSSKEALAKFTFDQADFQRKLKEVEYLFTDV